MGTIVRLDGRRLYVDVAVGNPIDAPVDITTEARFDACGSWVHFYPDGRDPNVYHMDHGTLGNKWEWAMNPYHRVTLESVEREIRLSNGPSRVFTSMLCCKMWQPQQNRILSLVNRSFAIHHADGQVEKRRLRTAAEIEDVLGSEYGLSRLPVREAIEVLKEFQVDVMAPDIT
jgi:arylamine N-acetyltransferase